MIRPLTPLRIDPAAVDVNITLTMNDGSVCRPLLSSGRLVLVGQTIPLRHEPPALSRPTRPPPPAVLRPLF